MDVPGARSRHLLSILSQLERERTSGLHSERNEESESFPSVSASARTRFGEHQPSSGSFSWFQLMWIESTILRHTVAVRTRCDLDVLSRSSGTGAVFSASDQYFAAEQQRLPSSAGNHQLRCFAGARRVGEKHQWNGDMLLLWWSVIDSRVGPNCFQLLSYSLLSNQIWRRQVGAIGIW